MISFRSIRESDIDEIRKVAQISWDFTYKDIFTEEYINGFIEKYYSKESLESLIPKVTVREQLFDVALDDSRIVGFCSVGLTPEGPRLYRIYLLPEYMGKGIGKKLLDKGKEFIKSKGENRLFCLVHNKNKSGINFYLRNDFDHVQEYDQKDEWYMEWTTDLE